MIGYKDWTFPTDMPGQHLYPEAYAKGSQRLINEARQSTRAQGYRRGQNTPQRHAIRAQHSPSCNMKFRGFSIPIQKFNNNLGVFKSWQTPAGQRSTSQYRNSAPSLNSPTPTAPIATRMPWNR